jgi:hypothetical protein
MTDIVILLIFAIVITCVPAVVVEIRNRLVLWRWRKNLKVDDFVQYINPRTGKPLTGFIKEIDFEGRAILFDPKDTYVWRTKISHLYPWPPDQKENQ